MYYAASMTICGAHAISEGGRMVLGAQAGKVGPTGCSAKPESPIFRAR